MILKAIPLLKGDQTVVVVFNEKEEDIAPEKDPKWTMSKDEMKAVSDSLHLNYGCWQKSRMRMGLRVLSLSRSRFNRN